MPLKIYQRGDVWHYRGTVAGRRLRGSTGARDRQAAESITAEIQARAWRSHIDGPASVLTFSEAAILYLDAGRSPRYLEKLIHHWRDTPVAKIPAAAIRQAAITLYPDASPATRNRQVLVPAQAVINHAAELELCPPIRVKRFRVTKKPIQLADIDWVRAFAAHASPHLGALALFMFYTRSRISEAVALDWNNVDLPNRRALVHSTKIGVMEWVHLPSEAFIAMANIPGKRRGPVFRYASRNSVQTAWATAESRAGIPHRHPHALCHGFATGLLRAGVDATTVAKLGRWKSPRHVHDTYSHAIEDNTLTDLLSDTKSTQPAKRQKPKALKK